MTLLAPRFPKGTFTVTVPSRLIAVQPVINPASSFDQPVTDLYATSIIFPLR
jgi:hypothetical protein